MPGFVLQAAPRPPADLGLPAVRVGFTVSRKVGNAVARNRVRRRLREVARMVIPARRGPISTMCWSAARPPSPVTSRPCARSCSRP